MIQEWDGADEVGLKERVNEAMRRHFRPEFLNRVGRIVLFQRIKEEEMESIVSLQLRQVEELLGDKRIGFSADKSLVRYLATQGYDPAFGARPLRRLIEEKILDELAIEIIDGRVKEGDRIQAAWNEKKSRVEFKATG
jgi:ATP-dependent Clp protease ATP-binding subunit ClpB